MRGSTEANEVFENFYTLDYMIGNYFKNLRMLQSHFLCCKPLLTQHPSSLWLNGWLICDGSIQIVFDIRNHLGLTFLFYYAYSFCVSVCASRFKYWVPLFCSLCYSVFVWLVWLTVVTWYFWSIPFIIWMFLCTWCKINVFSLLEYIYIIG